jgi:DNA modification methylase
MPTAKPPTRPTTPRQKAAPTRQEAPGPTIGTLGDLTPDPANRRTHNPRNLGMLVDALKVVGASRSIVVDEAGVILAGNGVVEAASAAGLTKLQIVDADGDTVVAVRRRGLTAAQKRQLAIYDNRTAELAEWNVAQLAADLQNGEDLTAFFLPDELTGLLGADVKGGLTDPDAVPPVRATEIQRGDLFDLGAHRLLCGDSTVAGDVARVMGDTRADLVFTSPPYGAGNVAKLRDHYVKGQANRQSFYMGSSDAPRDWLGLMGAWFAVLRPLVTTVIVNVQLLADNKRLILEWLYTNREDFCDVIVWDKVNAAPQMQRNVLSNAFEFLLIFGGNGSRAIPFADFHGSLMNMVRIDPRGKNDSSDVHRAVMPVELPTWIFAQLCPRAKTMIDPFSGTGTTVIAAEQLARTCRAIELEPQYVQVAIDRWEAFTGQRAVKVGEAVRA